MDKAKTHINRGGNKKTMIKEANVTVLVNDIEKAIRFYTNVVGLNLKAHYGDQFAQVEAPGTIIALHPFSSSGRVPAKSENMSIGFSVDNLDRALDDLKSKGGVVLANLR